MIVGSLKKTLFMILLETSLYYHGLRFHHTLPSTWYLMGVCVSILLLAVI